MIRAFVLGCLAGAGVVVGAALVAIEWSYRTQAPYVRRWVE